MPSGTGSVMPNAYHDYAELLKHKRVVIVGPARTLVLKRQGNLIDSYDLVVRMNDAFEHLPVPADLSRDIGTRTDILYCNQVILRKNILQEEGISRDRFLNVCDRAKIKYVLCTNNGLSFDRMGRPSPECDKEDESVIEDFTQFLSQNGIRTQFRVVHAASEMLIRLLEGNLGRTGLVAILDLLGFDISRLYVTGMTFYHGGGHLFSSDVSELHPLRNRDGTWARDGSGLGHNSYLELDLMRLFTRCFRRTLEVDEQFSRLLATGST